jgi:hypothetical protein
MDVIERLGSFLHVNGLVFEKDGRLSLALYL